MRVHILLLVGILNSIAISLYDARDQFLWLLEAAPVLLGVLALCITYRFYKFTTFTYGIIAFSFILVLIGAHYTYSNVPFLNLVKDEFNLSRNHFDRVGHFFQGAIPAIIMREFLARENILHKSKWFYVMIVFACLGISALYEIAEMTAAFMVHGATIDWFLGLQGDEWDTQKDMLMALIGAISALLLLGKTHDKALIKLQE
jgi:putative membrane protein